MSIQSELVLVNDEISELTRLAELAQLPSIKAFLNKEIERLSKKKSSFEQTKAVSTANVTSSAGLTTINNYMWDQTNDYIKIYIEVDKNQTIPPESIKFTPMSDTAFTCTFGKCKFTLGRLFKSVDMKKTAEKGVKVTKSNRVIITLYKSVAENWSSLNIQENAYKDTLEKDTKVNEDPSAGLMNLMKTMYDQGDDDMKRTIAKSWYESQNKKGADPFAM